MHSHNLSCTWTLSIICSLFRLINQKSTQIYFFQFSLHSKSSDYLGILYSSELQITSKYIANHQFISMSVWSVFNRDVVVSLERISFSITQHQVFGNSYDMAWYFEVWYGSMLISQRPFSTACLVEVLMDMQSTNKDFLLHLKQNNSNRTNL